MASTKRISLLKIEIKNRYVQENFKRLENYLNQVILDAIAELDPSSPENINNEGDSGGVIITDGLWEKGTSVASSSSTIILDLVPLSGLNSVTYHITFYNNSQAKRKRLELTVIKDGGTIKSVVSGVLGILNIAVNPVENGSNELEIRISNNELFDINISYARLVL